MFKHVAQSERVPFEGEVVFADIGKHTDDCNCVGPVLYMKPTLSKPAFAANRGSNDPSLMLRHREFPSATS